MVCSAIEQRKDIIQVENVFFTYPHQSGEDRLRALTNCSLRIKKGEFLAILGNNGSGKSTLVKHLNGLLTPQQGSVLVAGLDTRQQQYCWEIRRLVGMVFQNPDNQIVAATVEEDVAFGPENLGLPPDQIRQRVDYFLETLQLAAERNTPPHMLSGGQKQRLAIAGVLAMLPQCIVLDEPTAMLDTAGRVELLALLQKLKNEHNITVILVTHLMEEAALADRVVVLHQGSVALDTTPQQLFADPRNLKQFGLGVPKVVEIAIMLQRAGIEMKQVPLNVDQLVSMICRSLKV